MKPSSNIILITLIYIFIITTFTAKLQKGQLSILITQQNQQNLKYKVSINNKIKSQLPLTQSSKINIQVKLEFSPSDFKPEFISFRLRHKLYENLTEPVLAKYHSNEETYKVTIDLGDPRQIKPFSDKYQLQVIVADENLDKNIRHFIADCNINFRKSWETLPSSDLHYKTENIIETSAPAERVDPPRIFTLFVVLFIIVIDVIFFLGLSHLNVNVSLFPKSSSGLLMNVGFLVILMANLAVLLKFWINWTFLETLQYLLILVLPTALIANYALIHLKKD